MTHSSNIQLESSGIEPIQACVYTSCISNVRLMITDVRELRGMHLHRMRNA
jgi:hypothetical protein